MSEELEYQGASFAYENCGPVVMTYAEYNALKAKADLAADMERVAWALTHYWYFDNDPNENPKVCLLPPPTSDLATLPPFEVELNESGIPILTDELRTAIDKARAVAKGGGA